MQVGHEAGIRQTLRRASTAFGEILRPWTGSMDKAASRMVEWFHQISQSQRRALPMDKFAVLRQYFGHTEFRPGQETLVDGILAGRDVLGIMPTGGGKSLCYQIPALLLPGLTLVISPLISLMRDQVAALTGAGVPAAQLNSAQSLEESREVWRGIRSGAYRLIYIAPERLEKPAFLENMARQEISLVAVDEAHCISQWGQDFRPSYLKILDFVQALPRRPVVAAFTATATLQVQGDIALRLALQDPVHTVTGFDRPNLYFDVYKPKDKRSALRRLVAERGDKSGIVYCATRSAVEQVCDDLNAAGFSATRYHAGLSEVERRQNQDDFQFDRKLVMVATNAFGMGIDKSNVSYVFHYNMPKNLESYYQEAGRAGRDGEAADCILLYGPGDISTAKYFIDHNSDNSELDPEAQAELRGREMERLQRMMDYCKTEDCLRGRILDYFGQDHEPGCGNCGNCQGSFQQTDITIPAQMILSCIKRVKDRLGYYVGAALILRILRGSRDKRILELGLEDLSTYGLMKATPRELLQSYLDCLEAKGYVFIDSNYATLRPTPAAGGVLFHGVRVEMLTKIQPKPLLEQEPLALSSQGVDEGLLAALKEQRNKLAQREGVPAYIVFSNATLVDMARKTPRNREELLSVSGVGEVKAQRYGAEFLSVLQAYGRGTEEGEP